MKTLLLGLIALTSLSAFSQTTNEVDLFKDKNFYVECWSGSSNVFRANVFKATTVDNNLFIYKTREDLEVIGKPTTIVTNAVCVVTRVEKK